MKITKATATRYATITLESSDLKAIDSITPERFFVNLGSSIMLHDRETDIDTSHDVER